MGKDTALDGQTAAHDRHRRHERGAGLVEYALLVALITLACVASLRVFGVTNGGSVNKSASTYASAVN